MTPFASPSSLAASFQQQAYIADDSLLTAVYLLGRLGRPLLLEGHAGVGKTETAKVLSEILGAELIRLQCYEGLDINSAVYEWNYQKQLLSIRLAGDAAPPSGPAGSGVAGSGVAGSGVAGSGVAGSGVAGSGAGDAALAERERHIFGREFLLERPLLRAITREESPPVLLIDEVDRADEEFEAFLLELLADFQITIPEIGTVKARHRPHVILTSNRTRELSDALKRRCLYHWIDYPSAEKELAIIRAKVPQAAETLARGVVAAVQTLRGLKLAKPPGVAETLDWVIALLALGRPRLDEDTLETTMGCFLKSTEDFNLLRANVGRVMAAISEA